MAILSLQNISLALGGPLLLDKVNLQIEQGERICLVGRNGAGKSTLINLDQRPGQAGLGRHISQARSTIGDPSPGNPSASPRKDYRCCFLRSECEPLRRDTVRLGTPDPGEKNHDPA